MSTPSSHHEERPQLHLVDFQIPPAVPVEQRNFVDDLAPPQYPIPIHRTLVDPEQSLQIPFIIGPKEILVDIDPQVGQQETKPFYAGRRGGGVGARISFLAPIPGTSGHETAHTLKPETLALDFEQERLGYVSHIDIYHGYNPTVEFESNMQNPDLFPADQPNTHEARVALYAAYENLRGRTVVLDNRGNTEQQNRHNPTSLYIPGQSNDPEGRVELEAVALTANANNGDFRITDLDAPEVAAVGQGERKLVGTIHLTDEHLVLSMPGQILDVPMTKSHFAVVSTMKRLSRPTSIEDLSPDQAEYLRGIRHIAGSAIRAGAGGAQTRIGVSPQPDSVSPTPAHPELPATSAQSQSAALEFRRPALTDDEEDDLLDYAHDPSAENGYRVGTKPQSVGWSDKAAVKNPGKFSKLLGGGKRR